MKELDHAPQQFSSLASLQEAESDAWFVSFLRPYDDTQVEPDKEPSATDGDAEYGMLQVTPRKITVKGESWCSDETDVGYQKFLYSAGLSPEEWQSAAPIDKVSMRAKFDEKITNALFQGNSALDTLGTEVSKIQESGPTPHGSAVLDTLCSEVPSPKCSGRNQPRSKRFGEPRPVIRSATQLMLLQDKDKDKVALASKGWSSQDAPMSQDAVAMQAHWWQMQQQQAVMQATLCKCNTAEGVAQWMQQQVQWLQNQQSQLHLQNPMQPTQERTTFRSETSTSFGTSDGLSYGRPTFGTEYGQSPGSHRPSFDGEGQTRQQFGQEESCGVNLPPPPARYEEPETLSKGQEAAAALADYRRQEARARTQSEDEAAALADYQRQEALARAQSEDGAIIQGYHPSEEQFHNSSEEQVLKDFSFPTPPQHAVQKDHGGEKSEPSGRTSDGRFILVEM